MLLPDVSQKLWTWIFYLPNFCTSEFVTKACPLCLFICAGTQQWIVPKGPGDDWEGALSIDLVYVFWSFGWRRVQGSGFRVLGRRETKFAYTHWILRLFLEGAALEIQAKIGHSCRCMKEMYVPSALKSLLSHTLKVEFCGIWLEDRPHHCIKSCRSS